VSSRINVGVVGCARIFPRHLQGFKALREHGWDSFRITALCDVREEDARRFRKRGEGLGPRPSVVTHLTHDPLNAEHVYISDLHPDTIPDIYTDWREMLRSAKIDAVLILTPVFLHHQAALDALRAGKHVLTEKPLAITVRAAQRMVEEAERHRVSLGVAEVVRYLEGIRVTKFAIDAGLIGQVQMFLAGGMGSADWSPDRIQDKTPWHHRKFEAGAGPVINGGVHRYHEIRYLCGGVGEISALTPRFEPVRVTKDETGRVIDSVDNEVEDCYFAQFKLPNGGVGLLFGGPAGHGEPMGMGDGPVIYGSKGCLKLKRVFPHVVGGTAVLDGGQRISLTEYFESNAPAELKERWFPRGLSDGFGLEQLDWLRSIETKQPMETDGREGLHDIACCYATLESAALNRPVSPAQVESGAAYSYARDIDEHYEL
jgi:predicted dehydrogenase